MVKGVDLFFENLPKMLKASRVASLFDISIKTIYDWHYRPNKRKIPVPMGLIRKFNGDLFIDTEILKQWFASQNPSLA